MWSEVEDLEREGKVDLVDIRVRKATQEGMANDRNYMTDNEKGASLTRSEVIKSTLVTPPGDARTFPKGPTVSDRNCIRS